MTHDAEKDADRQSLRDEVAAAFLRGLYSGKWPEENDQEWARKAADDLLERVLPPDLSDDATH